MKKIILFACLTTFAVQAEFKIKPDPQTLWLEDGKSIQVSPKSSPDGWLNSKLEIKSLPDGGFSLTSPDKTRYSSGRYVPLDKAYPYIVFEISKIELIDKYLSYGFGMIKDVRCGMVAQLQKGIFVCPVTDFNGKSKFFSVYVYGHTLELKYIKCVKLPEQYITVEAPSPELKIGDKIKFNVFLKESAEDVTLRFFDNYCMPPISFNGMDKLQLKPENEDATHWSAVIEIKDFKPKKEYKKGAVLMKAVILGGNVPEPVWSPMLQSLKK